MDDSHQETSPDAPARGLEAAFDEAVALYEAGRLDAAAAGCRRILEAAPGHAGALQTLGIVAGRQGRLAEARRHFQRTVDLHPGIAMAQNNLGAVLRQLGALDEAIDCFRRATSLDPADAGAHNNLGLALLATGCLAEAARSFEQALAAAPDDPAVHNNLGVVLAELGRREEAAARYRRALALAPDYADPHANLGALMLAECHAQAAAACLERALALQPDRAGVHTLLGNALRELGRQEAAIAHYRRALALDPDLGEAAAALAFALREGCCWQELETLAPQVDALNDRALAADQRAPETPFMSVTRLASPARNLAVARSSSREIARRAARVEPPVHAARPSQDGKITIGYLSGDFHAHATAQLMGALFGCHDRTAFRILAYSYGPDDGSAQRRRIARDSDGFVDVRSLGHAEAAARIRGDGVDILVDLKGHTKGSRLEICALRPAPVQASWLGFPGSTGADFIDYLIADPVVAPAAEAGQFSEALVHLPQCYQVNDQAQPIAGTPESRAEAGLPEDAVVFCSFNRPFKIEPAVFARWMALLRGVPGSVLWLLAAGGLAEANLRAAAGAQGADSGRLLFAPPLAKGRHLRRLQFADLALDTGTCNGHTTTSDALWAGLPVVAVAGSHFASRVSASLLAAIGLPELVTPDLDAYEALAARLARRPAERAALSRRLAENRTRMPLFDTPRFARGLEAAYRQMWALHQAGEKPRLIRVQAD